MGESDTAERAGNDDGGRRVSAFASAFFSVANLVNVALSIAIVGVLGVGMTCRDPDRRDRPLRRIRRGPRRHRCDRRSPRNAGGSLPALATGILPRRPRRRCFVGLLVARWRVPSTPWTLATLSIYRGLAYWDQWWSIDRRIPTRFDLARAGHPARAPRARVGDAPRVRAGLVPPHTDHRRPVGLRHRRQRASRVARRCGYPARVVFATYLANGLLVGLAGVMLAARLARRSTERGRRIRCSMRDRRRRRWGNCASSADA